MLLLAPAEANLATCAPREPPATGRCYYDFPAPSALQGFSMLPVGDDDFENDNAPHCRFV